MWRTFKASKPGVNAFLRHSLLVILAGMVTGCITESQFRPFRTSLYKIEKEADAVQQRFTRLDKETKKSLMSMREDQANIKADMVDVRTEIQQMRGEFSVGQHKEDQGQKEDRALEEAVVLQLSHLQQKLQEAEERIVRLEELLALKQKAGTAGVGNIDKALPVKKQLPAAPKKQTGPVSAPDKILPESVYDKAYTTYQAGQYKEARKAFEEFVQLYPDSKYVNNALYWTGETFYRLGDYENAILKYEEVIEKYPKESKAPDAMLKMGFAFEMMGETQAAIAALERLLREYPTADQVELANRKVTQLKQKKRSAKEDRGNEAKQTSNPTATEKKPPEKSTP